MVTYRKARPEERKAYIEFADMVFSSNGDPISFEQSIPKVYGAHIDSADMQYIGIDDEKGIRGLVAVMPNELYLGSEMLKVGYVGTVSVHPEARGEGHMKALMKMAIKEMEKKGVDLSLLGGHRQRYEYFGYAKSGVSVHVDVSEPNVRHALKHVNADGVTFEEIGHDSPWLKPAHALFEQRFIRFRRDIGAFVDCCRNYLTQLWAILDEGEFVGYLVCNSDQNGFSEICTVSADVLDKAIKAWIVQGKSRRVTMMFAPWEREALRRLGTYAGGMRIQSSVQASVLNPRRVLKVMLTAKAAYAKLENAEMCFEIEGDRFTVAVKDGAVDIVDGGENPVCLNRLAASQLFGDFFDYEGRPETPDGWFPLPIYEASPDAF